jgi:hypothetical protein
MKDYLVDQSVHRTLLICRHAQEASRAYSAFGDEAQGQGLLQSRSSRRLRGLLAC